MKPHRLVLAGFGAFAKRAEIDFDRLSEFGLYLIIGETGSGKTTIAKALEKKLHLNNIISQLHDGDNIRVGISNNLSFSSEIESKYF